MAVDVSENGGGAPATASAVIAPSDVSDLSFMTRFIYVGGTGTLTVIDASGNTTLFSGIPAGTILPIRASRVKATGTSATLLVALW